MTAVRFNRRDISSLNTLRVERDVARLTLRRGSRPVLLTVGLAVVFAAMIGVVWLGEFSNNSSASRDFLRSLVIGAIAVVLIVAVIAGFENRTLRDKPPEIVIDTARRLAKVKGGASEVHVSKVTIRLVDVTWRVSTEDGSYANMQTTLAMIGVASDSGVAWTGIGGFGVRAAKLLRRLSPLAEFITITIDPTAGYIQDELFDVLV